MTEDVEGLREERDVGDKPQAKSEDEHMGDMGEETRDASRSPAPESAPPPTTDAQHRCVATLIEVQDAFDSLNTLRYSQPTHLQGRQASSYVYLIVTSLTYSRPQANAKA